VTSPEARSRRLSREERLALARQILARLDARRAAGERPRARQLELFRPEQGEGS
jgi:hypothetical protein